LNSITKTCRLPSYDLLALTDRGPADNSQQQKKAGCKLLVRLSFLRGVSGYNPAKSSGRKP